MSRINDLTKFKESDTYINIIEKLRNKREALETQILQQFPNVDNEHIYGNHDINYQKMEFDLDMLEQIPKWDKWADILIKELENEVDKIKTFLIFGVKDSYGITNSTPVYSELDMGRWKVQDMKQFEWLIDHLIEAEKPQKEEIDDESF